MKPGNIVICKGGHRGIILAINKMYPGHPDSPIDTLEVAWQGKPPSYGFTRYKGVGRAITVWSVREVIKC